MLPFTTTSMDLEGTVLCAQSHTEGEKHCTAPLLLGTKKPPNSWKRSVKRLLPGAGGKGTRRGHERAQTFSDTSPSMQQREDTVVPLQCALTHAHMRAHTRTHTRARVKGWTACDHA